jgi:hypothetical protein
VAQSLKLIQRSLWVVLVVRGKIVDADLPVGVDAVVPDHDALALTATLKHLLNGY